MPRIAKEPLGALPAKLDFDLSGLGGTRRFALAALRRGLTGPKPDVVVCGHLYLLPVCALIAKLRGARLDLLIFGIDAWEPTGRIADRLTGMVDHVVSISQVTLDRYLRWARPPRAGTALLPNAVHAADYGVGPKAPDLVETFGLAGRTVLMTFGRLAARERAKGFDRMIEVLPMLRAEDPSIIYVIAGVGDDRLRLEEKAARRGVAEHVVFTGLVPEARKADYFRLADAYVMPSHGEGFGFVFLEAMACGVPAVASRTDGGVEAIRGGEIGITVDPEDPVSVRDGVMAALARPRGVPAGLSYFSFENFTARLRAILFPNAAKG
ncbi:MAG: glycosyltransferase family 1 protein [Sphingomonadales bacterium]|nr:MAG: glycosyltransferase family 1 protein [Sphingomonadales bacterium]